MTPSQRAAEIEAFAFSIADLCENLLRVAADARAVGLEPIAPGLNHVDQLAKRIRHKLADLGPPPEHALNGVCPECGEMSTGA